MTIMKIICVLIIMKKWLMIIMIINDNSNENINVYQMIMKIMK